MLDNAIVQTALEEYEFSPAPTKRWLLERDGITVLSLLFDIPRDGHPQSHLSCAITETEIEHASLADLLTVKLADMQRELERVL